jgi:hypothetical protein
MDMPIPRELLSDNGGEFTSQLFADLMKSYGIKHIMSAPYSPATNGVLERFHGYLNAVVRLTVNLSRNGDWWPAVRGGISTYRKLPHTSSGESPMFLWMGQEPTYAIDHLLPTLSRQVWGDTDNNCLDLQQLRTAYALGRKNLCLARKKCNTKIKMLDTVPLQVGDRVYRQNFGSNANKIDFKWEPGWRIVDFETSRTAIIEHTRSKIKARVNVRHLRWADPVSELIDNSNIDVFPGGSKLYFSAEDLKDLNWDALEQLPELAPDLAQKAAEIVRDRSSDLTVQQTPGKRTRTDSESSESGTVPVVSRRPQRKKKRSVKLKDFLCNTGSSTVVKL